MDCVRCGGAGCDLCDKKGTFDIDRCPLEIITDDVVDMMELADLWEKGLPPVAGGVLDQAAMFVAAARFYFGEKAYWKNKLGILSF